MATRLELNQEVLLNGDREPVYSNDVCVRHPDGEKDGEEALNEIG